MGAQPVPAAISHPGARALLHEPPGGDPDKLTLVRALGSLVWDDTGKRYIAAKVRSKPGTTSSAAPIV